MAKIVHKKLAYIWAYYDELEREGKKPDRADFIKLVSSKFEITDRTSTRYVDEMFRIMNLTPAERAAIEKAQMDEIDKVFGR